MTTLRTVYADMVAQFKAAGVVDASLDAKLLLAHAAGVPSSRILLELDEPAIGATFVLAQGFANRRAIDREPVAKILGTKSFWGRQFHVNAHVLDPRPETEELVAAALRAPFQSVLDLGTGSGCILLSLLGDRPMAWGVGVDASVQALQVARKNANKIGLNDRAQFLKSDWFAQVPEKSFDLIVSNPPYVTDAEYKTISAETRHDPRMALTDGDDGLTAYRAIADSVDPFLNAGGRLLFEIGPTQSKDVKQILIAAGFDNPTHFCDIDDRPRVISAVKAK